MPADTHKGPAHALAWLALAWALWSPPAAACGETPSRTPQYRHRAVHVAARLGAAPGYAVAHGWSLQPEASELVQAGQDIYGRPLRLAPGAAAALRAMREAAARDGITLQAVSGFRSFAYQRHLLRRKLDRGLPLASVLQVNTLPGFSEHHSGCALDLTTPGVPAADAAFATTPAFAWLNRHAGEFGFELSYPAGNPRGIAFEPWHWRYAEAPSAGDGLLAQMPSHHGETAAPAGRKHDRSRDAAALAGVSVRTYPIVQGYP
jgi:hypothetical protein